MEDKHTIITDEIIARYLAGESGPEEAMALHEWLELAENKQHFESFRQTWDNAYPIKKSSASDRTQAWKTLHEKLHAETGQQHQLPAIKPVRGEYYLIKIAAATLVFAVVGIFTYLKFTGAEPVVLSEVTHDTIRVITLPDHSKATLSQHSTITYNKDFEGELREVKLSGEAFFKVTHNPHKPFIVHTELADVRVVGTAFNVAINGNTIGVSVSEGKVLVYAKGDSIYLTPGKGASISNQESSTTSSSMDVNVNDWGYATRKFEFKNTVLSEVFACIEKSYPYSIKVQNDAIKNCKFTATFDNASAEYIVTLIAETLDLTLTKKGNVFYLEGKGCL